MRNIYQLLILALFLGLISGNSYAQINSTNGGGPWDSTWTWVGGTVPTAVHDVVINGPVYSSNNECNNLTVNISGHLQNNFYNHTLTVNGNLANHGAITNYGNHFFINIAGNIINDGAWTNERTFLNGSGDQILTCVNGNSVASHLFQSNKPSGNVVINSAAFFENYTLEMSGTEIHLTGTANMDIHDGYLKNCSIIGNGTNTSVTGIGTFDNDAPKFQNVSFTDLSLFGDLKMSSGCSTHGTVISNGSIQNDYYNSTLEVYDDFINNGTIRNYALNFTLHLYGNFTNNNVVDNYAIDFYGSTDQSVSLMSGKTFSPIYWSSFKPSGNIEALTDLEFHDAIINLDFDTLVMQNNSMFSFSEGSFSNAVLRANNAKSGDFTFHSGNNTSSIRLTLFNATLTGVMRCGTDVNFYGTTTNDGIFENDYYNKNPDLHGLFINNGTIQNYANYLFINIYGDFLNYGTVENSEMRFTGSADQTLELQAGAVLSPSHLISQKPTGKLIALSDLNFYDVAINMNDDTLLLQNNGKIYLEKGFLDNAVVYGMDAKAGNIQFHLTDDAYVENSTLKNPEFLGKVRIGPGMFVQGELLVTDTLENNYYPNTLTLEGSITNNGLIQNYANSLRVDITGDITNNGVWQNSFTYLMGTGNQHVTCLNSARFSGYQFFSSNTAGNVYFNDFVGFDNTQVKFQGNALMLSANSELLLHGAFLTDCNMYGSGTSSVLFGEGVYNTDGPYFQYCVLEDITIDGNWGIGINNTFNGLITNDGVLQNAYYSYTVEVNAHFINNGTIQSFANNLNMNMYSDFENNGIWNGYSININGATDQEIFQGVGLFFGPTYFNSYKPSGYIKATSDLSFVNTYVNLEHDTLIMPDNSILSVSDRRLIRCDVLPESGRFTLSMENDAYLDDCNIHNANLDGTVIVKDTYFTGTSINYGTLQNDYYSYTAHFYGDLINFGTIQNYANAFFLNAYADITNYGIWQNYYTQMVGTNDQYVHLMNNHWIDGEMRFVSDVQVSPYQWYWNGWAIENPPYPQPPIIIGETSNTLRWISPVDDGWVGTYYCNAGGTNSRNIHIESSTNYQASLKVFLQGPFDDPEMKTLMNAGGYLPLNQPYNIAPWNYSGSETVAGIPNTDIVDWVLVEFRDAADAVSASASTMVAQQAAFLLKDGTVVGMDGTSSLSIDFTAQQSLFAVIWHRNHLGVMSAYPLSEINGSFTYDFSSGADQVFGGANGHAELTLGIWGLVAADGNADGQINNTDKNVVWSLQAGGSGYLTGDFNLDSQVNNNDKNDLWVPNSGSGGQVPASPGGYSGKPSSPEGKSGKPDGLGNGYNCQVPK